MALVASRRNKDYFSSYVLQRIERNKNFIACVTGPTGSGKSYTALRLAEALDSDFDGDNIVFTPSDFMKLINGKTKKLRSGSVIVFDEIQVSMGHMDYQTIQAKMLNYVMQTFRHKNFILLVTSPHFAFINASARKLFHCRMETVSINPKKKTVQVKPFLLQVNQDKGDIYRKYLRVAQGGSVTAVKVLRVGMPSLKLRRTYEAKKTEFTTKLNRSIEKDLIKLEGGEKPKKELTKKQEEVLKGLFDGKLINEIAEQMNISERAIYSQINFIKKKGVRIKAVKNKNNEAQRYEVTDFGEVGSI